MGGQRWAIDLGNDVYLPREQTCTVSPDLGPLFIRISSPRSRYQLPGYWTQTNEARYKYYRKSTAGHNTLTFNRNDATPGTCGQDPSSAGITEISLFEHDESQGGNPSSEAYVAGGGSPAYAIVDLTAAYSKQGAASHVQRGFAFTPSFEQLL